jgi:GT2 family glycosyltransferase
MLIRREALEALGGLDEGFFLYGEDIDLCRRIRDAGWDIRFEPGATVMHVGGVSAPRGDLLPVLAASRLRYARKHKSRPEAALIRAGVGLSALTHALVGRGGPSMRQGHVRALRRAWSG